MTAITTRRTLCTTADAASILGVTMCRVRQLAKAGAPWSELIGPYVRVFDRDEVTRRARVLDIDRARARSRPGPGRIQARPLEPCREGPPWKDQDTPETLVSLEAGEPLRLFSCTGVSGTIKRSVATRSPYGEGHGPARGGIPRSD